MATPDEVLLDQARLQLARQEATIDSLRTVSGAVLGIGGVVAAFIAPGLADTHPWYSVPGLVAFVTGVVLGLLVLAPRGGFDFSEGLDTYLLWLEEYGNQPDADTIFVRGLVANLEGSRRQNVPLIRPLPRLLKWQVIAVGSEVLLWVIARLVA